MDNILTAKDVRRELYEHVRHGDIITSGHKLEQQGERYVELNDVLVDCYDNYIIDAPEYENLNDGTWYDENYLPRVIDQTHIVVEKLIKDTDSRQGVISIYNPDDAPNDDVPCTMYMCVRLKPNRNGGYILCYTIHMRSCDVREYRSDIKFHKKIVSAIQLVLKDNDINVELITMTLFANSLQCWEKDFEFLPK